MKLGPLSLIFLLNAESFALSMGETIALSVKNVTTSSGEQVELEPRIRVFGADRAYEAFYDLKNIEMIDEKVFDEIQKIFAQEKNSILELDVNWAGITAFVKENPGYSCFFKSESGWEPFCIKHDKELFNP